MLSALVAFSLAADLIPPGGPVVNGLQASLRAEPRPAGVALVLEIKNVTDLARLFVPIERWDESLPEVMHVSGKPYVEAQVILRRIDRAPRSFGLISGGWHGSAEVQVVTLEPGASRKYVREYALEPGDYEAEVLYWGLAKAVYEVDLSDLRSNRARFSVLRLR